MLPFRTPDLLLIASTTKLFSYSILKYLTIFIYIFSERNIYIQTRNETALVKRSVTWVFSACPLLGRLVIKIYSLLILPNCLPLKLGHKIYCCINCELHLKVVLYVKCKFSKRISHFLVTQSSVMVQIDSNYHIDYSIFFHITQMMQLTRRLPIRRHHGRRPYGILFKLINVFKNIYKIYVRKIFVSTNQISLV